MEFILRLPVRIQSLCPLGFCEMIEPPQPFRSTIHGQVEARSTSWPPTILFEDRSKGFSGVGQVSPAGSETGPSSQSFKPQKSLPMVRILFIHFFHLEKIYRCSILSHFLPLEGASGPFVSLHADVRVDVLESHLRHSNQVRASILLFIKKFDINLFIGRLLSSPVAVS